MIATRNQRLEQKFMNKAFALQQQNFCVQFLLSLFKYLYISLYNSLGGYLNYELDSKIEFLPSVGKLCKKAENLNSVKSRLFWANIWLGYWFEQISNRMVFFSNGKNFKGGICPYSLEIIWFFFSDFFPLFLPTRDDIFSIFKRQEAEQAPGAVQLFSQLREHRARTKEADIRPAKMSAHSACILLHWMFEGSKRLSAWQQQTVAYKF